MIQVSKGLVGINHFLFVLLVLVHLAQEPLLLGIGMIKDAPVRGIMVHMEVALVLRIYQCVITQQGYVVCVKQVFGMQQKGHARNV